MRRYFQSFWINYTNIRAYIEDEYFHSNPSYTGPADQRDMAIMESMLAKMASMELKIWVITQQHIERPVSSNSFAPSLQKNIHHHSVKHPKGEAMPEPYRSKQVDSQKYIPPYRVQWNQAYRIGNRESVSEVQRRQAPQKKVLVSSPEGNKQKSVC